MNLRARPSVWVAPQRPAAITPSELPLEPGWELHPQHPLWGRVAAGADLIACPRASCGGNHPWWALTADVNGRRASLLCPEVI